MMNKLEGDVLDFVKRYGPVIPIQVSKSFNKDIIIASALLSGLVGNRLIKISKAKVGGTPVYYAPGQEEKLQGLRDHLSEKPKKAFDLLKENHILRDKMCEPWQRVALREIKDFAIPFYANIDGQEEIVWKWYLTSDEEAEKILSIFLNKKAEKEIKAPLPEKEAVKEKPKAETKKRESKGGNDDANSFYHQLMEFFQKRSVKLLDEQIVRKNSEINFMAKIQSSLGILTYYVKCKNKKNISDGDLSLAYSEGVEKKLPTMFVSTGTPNKKAERFLQEKAKGLVFVKL